MPEIKVTLPTLHDDQVRAYRMPGRFKAIRCGRRWGKSLMAGAIAADAAIKGRSVGIFAPAYKFLAEFYNDLINILSPVIKSASRVDGVIRTVTGGRIDFWSLENDRAGRSRKYHIVIIDEAAFAGPNMTAIWEQAIEPTLLDYTGTALALSNANGNDTENFFWRICNDPKYGFREYHAPTRNNPYMPAAEIERLKATKHPLVFAQEYEAEFVDFSGAEFFARDHLLVDGKPVETPKRCDTVFATMDTAVKSGKEHDATAVVYWSYDRFDPIPLRILDYDIVMMDGALLEHWLPGVFRRLEEMARRCGARFGSQGAWLEDRASGIVLIQQAAQRGWPAQAVDSKFTALGKSERAVSVSGYVYQGLVKVTHAAHDRIIDLKGVERNHLLSQLSNFRVGDKDGAAAADDLLDAFVYGVALSLGNSDGF